MEFDHRDDYDPNVPEVTEMEVSEYVRHLWMEEEKSRHSKRDHLAMDVADDYHIELGLVEIGNSRNLLRRSYYYYLIEKRYIQIHLFRFCSSQDVDSLFSGYGYEKV